MAHLQSRQKTILTNEKNATLSPIYDPARPNSLLYTTTEQYDRLFATPFRRLSPGAVSRKGILNDFFCRSCIGKIRADFARGFDYSMVLYPSRLEMLAWGIIIDRVGRIFHADTPQEGYLELTYQGGACSNAKDWRRLVKSQDLNEESAVSLFYRRASALGRGRVEVAATVGFGFWDVLWMTFGHEFALEQIKAETELASEVLKYWKEFHLAAIRGMISAGVKCVFFRENPAGFSEFDENLPLLFDRLDSYYRAITTFARDNGAAVFFDCGSPGILSTFSLYRWDFDGVGPLVFSTRGELNSAINALGEDLTLIASVRQPSERLFSVTDEALPA